jgi:orotidine-5'-phosphate decarboxylase
MKTLDRVAVALDTSDWETFRAWSARFGPRVGVLKVGLEAYVRWGPAAVEEARGHGAAVFLDLKLHDIPNTVAGAVRAAVDLGVTYLTVHAAGGPAMLEAAATAAGAQLRLLAVTLLTHLDASALALLELPGDGATRALGWARLAASSGCAGAVCSPRETAMLRRALAPPFLLVNPGIRTAGEATDDQRRTASPQEALRAGADLLVIGRPLTQARDPERALVELAAALAS